MEHLGDQACCRNEGMCACFDRLAVPAAFHLYTRIIMSGTLVPPVLVLDGAQKSSRTRTRGQVEAEKEEIVCAVWSVYMYCKGAGRAELYVRI